VRELLSASRTRTGDAITDRESGHDLTRMSDAAPAAGDSLD
jgi:hypothetical protein